MERLQYIVEDSTLAELLGVQNFTNDESAVLELVKNAYDAKASQLSLEFQGDQLIIIDNGTGMSADDIKLHWMHVGKSAKEYEIIDENNNKRILAGSKGIGRFALARLGQRVCIYSKKDTEMGVVWNTDWNVSTLNEDVTITNTGTKIVINGLREKWGKRKIENLVDFLSKTYNDDVMVINVIHTDITKEISKYFSRPQIGKNCLSNITLYYDSKKNEIITKVKSDEFLDEAKKYCPEIDLKNHFSNTNMVDELKNSIDLDLSFNELQEYLTNLGDFTAQLYFNIKSSLSEMDRFLYKYSSLTDGFKSGIILYRNAFGISSYEGKKDWLGLGKRSRKSPAAASHPTGAWRARENQLSGKVEIDKKENAVLQDLSNRQGLDENIYYLLFVEIILTGIKEFERYRQEIIRAIDVKNKEHKIEKPTLVSDKIVSNPQNILKLSTQEAEQLVAEIKSYKKESKDFKREKENVEERYKYDVRILNVLATTGLKASSIAHEMRNDRNSIAENSENIIRALQEYGMWEELQSDDKTARAYKNVPYLIKSNSEVGQKIVTFMDTMLSEVEKKQFEASWQSISDILNNIKNTWERDYAWITITVGLDEDICFMTSEDIVRVIFDNLILNSIQQNENNTHLNIRIDTKQVNDFLQFIYSDDGIGLDKKYISNTKKILEVHETTRKNGHGLGMWIVNNTVVMSGGEIRRISGQPGFSIEFILGGKV